METSVAGRTGVPTVAPTGYAALRRPALRPGLRVVRRDDGHLQLGLDPPDQLVLADRPRLLETLTALDRRPDPALLPTLDRLAAEGWVVDADVQAAAVREQVGGRPPVALAADPPLVETVARACAAAGLRVLDAPGPATLRLVATLDEPRRQVSDTLVRDDVPHVFVTVLPRSVRIGPFVEPGRTPCLRCVDAHLGERDPRRATVLYQLEQLPSRHDRWDRGLAQLACAWATRDVVRRLDGAVPALRAATVTVSDDLEVTHGAWLRHPHCGCAWG
jgi:hypothetical protein